MPDARQRCARPDAPDRPHSTAARRAMWGTTALSVVVAAVAVAVVALSPDSAEQRPGPVIEDAAVDAGAVEDRADVNSQALRATEALDVVLATHPELQPDRGPFRYEARAALALAGQTVLIAAATHAEALPNTSGTLGIFYLIQGRAGPQVTGLWPLLTIGAPMGRPPEFRISEAFGPSPVIVVTARDVRGGIACELTQLVELNTSGPLVSDPFVSGTDARGAEGPSGRVWQGHIQEIIPGKGFTLETATDRISFVRSEGRYMPADGSEAPVC